MPVYKVLSCETYGVVPLECPRGHVIEGISAFYGRDDKPICLNDTDINMTNCSSNTATGVVKVNFFLIKVNDVITPVVNNLIFYLDKAKDVIHLLIKVNDVINL